VEHEIENATLKICNAHLRNRNVRGSCADGDKDNGFILNSCVSSEDLRRLHLKTPHNVRATSRVGEYLGLLFLLVEVFLIVLYLSLTAFNFRDRKNEYCAQRG